MARNRSPRLLAVLGATALLFLAACGDSDESTTTTTAADDTSSTTEAAAPAGGSDTVTISNFAYSDTPVQAGATVSVVNEDDVPHSVTSDDDAFDSDRVQGGASGSFEAPTEPGEYTIHCIVHDTMSGTLVVEA